MFDSSFWRNSHLSNRTYVQLKNLHIYRMWPYLNWALNSSRHLFPNVPDFQSKVSEVDSYTEHYAHFDFVRKAKICLFNDAGVQIWSQPSKQHWPSSTRSMLRYNANIGYSDALVHIMICWCLLGYTYFFGIRVYASNTPKLTLNLKLL